MNSQHCFIDTNSLPKDELSQLVCFLDIQYNGALFTYIIIPVLDFHVNVSPAWSASTIYVTKKPTPLDARMFGGRSSLP